MLTSRLVVTVLLLLAACTRAETPEQRAARMSAETDSLRPIVDSAVANYNREYNAGHVEPLVMRYASDARIMPPNAPPIGRDSLRSLFVAAFRGGAPNGHIDVRMERVIRSGPLAVVRAHWAFQPSDTDLPADTGSSITVWQQQHDGAWKIIEDIWHSDLPPRPQPQPQPARRR